MATNGADAHNIRQWYYSCERMTAFWRIERSVLQTRQRNLLAAAGTPHVVGLTATQARERIVAIDRCLRRLDEDMTRLNADHFDLVGEFVDVGQFIRSA